MRRLVRIFAFASARAPAQPTRMTRLGAFWTRMKTILLILGVCRLCSKAIVHTWRHFNPPPPPIVGP